MELIKTIENQLPQVDLQAISDKALEMAGHLNALAITEDNATSLEDLRTQANKFIKGTKDSLKEAKEAFLEPFTAVEQKVLEAIKPLELENKDFSAKILEVKKAKRYKEAKCYYDSLIAPNEDGEMPYAEIPSFDSIYVEIPQSASKETIHRYIENALELAQKTTANVELKGSRNALLQLRQYAQSLKIDWTLKD